MEYRAPQGTRHTRYGKSERTERAVSRFSPTGIPGYTQSARLANFLWSLWNYHCLLCGYSPWRDKLGHGGTMVSLNCFAPQDELLAIGVIRETWLYLVSAFPTFFALRRINAIIRIAMAPRPHSYLHCPLANPRWALGGCKGPHFIPILPSTLFFLRFLFTLFF